MIDGAVWFCRGATTTIGAAFASVIGELGYVRTQAAADLEIAIAAGPRAMCFSGPMTAAPALAVGKRLAARLAAPVRVMTAHLIEGKDASFSCDVRDVTVTAAGAANPGTWAEALERDHVHSWDDVCDGKAYFAVSSLVRDARDTVLPDGVLGDSIHFAAPTSLGSMRLDEIARQVRFADRTQLATMDGRACIRITSVGTTITSFVEPGELAILRTALGSLLERR